MPDLLGIWNNLIITYKEPNETSFKTQVTLTAFFSHKLKDYCLKVLTSEQNTILLIFTMHPEGKWAAGASDPLTGAEINREREKKDTVSTILGKVQKPRFQPEKQKVLIIECRIFSHNSSLFFTVKLIYIYTQKNLCLLNKFYI